MNRAFKKSRAEDGFTLLELLIVIVIIGILAAIAVPVFLNAQNAAHDASVKSDARNTVIGVAAGLVTKPDATGFSVLAPGDTTAAVKLAGVPTVIVTVPTGAVAVRAVVTQSNWVTVQGTGADYVVHAQSTIDGFWYEFSSKTGKYTSSVKPDPTTANPNPIAPTPLVPSTPTPPPNSVENLNGTPVRILGEPVTTTGTGGGAGTGGTGSNAPAMLSTYAEDTVNGFYLDANPSAVIKPISFPWIANNTETSKTVTDVVAIVNGVAVPVLQDGWTVYYLNYHPNSEIVFTNYNYKAIANGDKDIITALFKNGSISATVDGVLGNRMVFKDTPSSVNLPFSDPGIYKDAMFFNNPQISWSRDTSGNSVSRINLDLYAPATKGVKSPTNFPYLPFLSSIWAPRVQQMAPVQVDVTNVRIVRPDMTFIAQDPLPILVTEGYPADGTLGSTAYLTNDWSSATVPGVRVGADMSVPDADMPAGVEIARTLREDNRVGTATTEENNQYKTYYNTFVQSFVGGYVSFDYNGVSNRIMITQDSVKHTLIP